MPRSWRGVIAQENTQTGDGRVIAAGALEWAELPLPLAWIRDGDQHVMSMAAPVIGTIESITRSGSDIIGEGTIDDASPDGAEMIRMLEAGTASGGARQFISIDPDDWEVEIILMDPELAQEESMLVASGSGPLRDLRRALTAAAGDPDPGEGGGSEGVTMYEDASDMVIERFTRLRIRGATLCAVSAFDGAWIELTDGGEAAEPVEPDATAAVQAAVDAAAPGQNVVVPRGEHRITRTIVAHAPATPPDEFFTDPELPEVQRWVTVTPEGRVFGHLAAFGECHIGMPGRCITPEVLMAGGFDYFRHGHVVAASGPIATGPIALRGGHADARLNWRQAQAHYDDPACAVMDVSVGTDEHGVWFSGAIRPGASEADVYAVRASGVSGDWRLIGGQLRLVGICSVNVPGFPKLRAAVASGQITSLVAAGGRPMAPWEHRPCVKCSEADIEKRLERLERHNEAAIIASLDVRAGYVDPFAALDARVTR